MNVTNLNKLKKKNNLTAV